MSTGIICLALLMLCIFGIKSYAKRLSHGCCGGGGDTVKRVRPADKDRTHYLYAYQIGIEGMTCGSCKTRVENAFNATEGLYARVDLPKHAAVLYAKTPLTEQQVRDILRKAGYREVSFREV